MIANAGKCGYRLRHRGEHRTRGRLLANVSVARAIREGQEARHRARRTCQNLSSRGAIAQGKKRAF
jgi:hypothetical protein